MAVARICTSDIVIHDEFRRKGIVLYDAMTNMAVEF